MGGLNDKEQGAIHRVFQKLDKDNSGTLDRLELIIGLIDMGVPDASLSMVEDMLQEAGMPHTKEINMEEFKVLWKNSKKFSWGKSFGKLFSGMSMMNFMESSTTADSPETSLPPSGKPIRDDIEKFYSIKDEIGSGAYSTVFLATAKETTENYAVKVVNKQVLQSKEDIDALFEEVGILQELNHPHIMRLHAFYEDDEKFTLVTELVKGGELFDRIVKREHYDEKHARDLVKIFLEVRMLIDDRNSIFF